MRILDVLNISDDRARYLKNIVSDILKDSKNNNMEILSAEAILKIEKRDELTTIDKLYLVYSIGYAIGRLEC